MKIDSVRDSSPASLYRLGVNYEKGPKKNRNLKKAVSFYEQAAEQNYSDALISLGYCYAEGKGVVKDLNEATRYFKLAIQQGPGDDPRYKDGFWEFVTRYPILPVVDQEAIALYFLGAYHNQLKYYHLSAEKGYANAQYAMGSFYNSGEHVKKDHVKAFKYFKLAADQGHIVAINNIAFCYEKGMGIEKNLEEAIKYYKQAAEKNDTEAQATLGSLYATGEGLKKDYSEARKYFTRAAEQGDLNGQYNLGLLYQKGRGVQQDLKKAYKYFRLAAAQGHKDAQHYVDHYCGVLFDESKSAPAKMPTELLQLINQKISSFEEVKKTTVPEKQPGNTKSLEIKHEKRPKKNKSQAKIAAEKKIQNFDTDVNVPLSRALEDEKRVREERIKQNSLGVINQTDQELQKKLKQTILSLADISETDRSHFESQINKIKNEASSSTENLNIDNEQLNNIQNKLEKLKNNLEFLVKAITKKIEQHKKHLTPVPVKPVKKNKSDKPQKKSKLQKQKKSVIELSSELKKSSPPKEDKPKNRSPISRPDYYSTHFFQQNRTPLPSIIGLLDRLDIVFQNESKENPARDVVENPIKLALLFSMFLMAQIVLPYTSKGTTAHRNIKNIRDHLNHRLSTAFDCTYDQVALSEIRGMSRELFNSMRSACGQKIFNQQFLQEIEHKKLKNLISAAENDVSPFVPSVKFNFLINGLTQQLTEAEQQSNATGAVIYQLARDFLITCDTCPSGKKDVNPDLLKTIQDLGNSRRHAEAFKYLQKVLNPVLKEPVAGAHDEGNLPLSSNEI